MFRKYIITSLLLSVSIYTYAQFTKIFNTSDGSQKILINDIGVIIMPISNGVGGGINRVDTIGNLIWSKNIINPISVEKIKTSTRCMNDNGDFTLLNQFFENRENKFGISLLDSNGDISWSKQFQLDFCPTQFNVNYFTDVFCLDDKYFFIGNYMIHELDQPVVSVIALDKDGELLWRKEFNDPNDLDAQYDFYALENGLFALVRSNINTDKSNVYLFDSEFEFQRGYNVNLFIDHIQFRDGKYYIIGESSYLRSPRVVCLDENWTVLWNRFLKSNIFNPQGIQIVLTNKGIVTKTIDVFADSELFSLLSYKGDLLGAWRLPSLLGLSGFMSSSNNNIIYFAFASSFENNASDSFTAFHDPEFENFGCYLPESCIEMEDFDVFIEERPNPFSPIFLNIEIEDTGFISQDTTVDSGIDFCPDNFTPIAVPLFSSDDTICVNEMVPLINLQNVNAESVEWDIPGSSLGFSDIKEPVFSYSEPGTYSITQTVEYAGCFSDFTVTVEVVPPRELVVDTAAFLCDDRPVELDATQTFDADYLWLPDSSTNSSLLVNDAGVYTVEVSDNFCTQSANIRLNDFDFNLVTVELPSDTFICEQQPFVFSASIDANAAFQWSDSFPDLNRNISESGFYTLTTSLENCSTSTSINLIAEDCSTQIYVPNAFSPNGDGINDTFIPLGNFFEILDFKIYNRWGGLVHDDLTQAWDGKTETKNHPLGVYVYSLKIRNTLLDEVEFLKGDVLLAR